MTEFINNILAKLHKCENSLKVKVLFLQIYPDVLQADKSLVKNMFLMLNSYIPIFNYYDIPLKERHVKLTLKSKTSKGVTESSVELTGLLIYLYVSYRL